LLLQWTAQKDAPPLSSPFLATLRVARNRGADFVQRRDYK
jgi:hypothetical protein